MPKALLWFLELLPAIITGLVLYYWQRQQKKRDAEAHEIAKARQRESLLTMQLIQATAKLSFAVATAIKRGYPNGEVEDGITAFNEANEAYETFLREQTTTHLHT